MARELPTVHRLTHPLNELIPAQRSIVHCTRQPESVIDERALAAHIALVHRPDLRNRDMRFVDDEEEVLREVVDEAIGRAPLLTAIDMAGVILDTSA